ncbi:sugar ABC transporter ATP-binding protein [soil metagenome]
MNNSILEFQQMEKSFFGVPVLRDVSLAVGKGRILGLVGENGAGKSTLMNILGGVLLADSGRMMLDGAAYAPEGPAEATRQGVAFIHQELNLFTNLSIAENLSLPDFARPGRRWLPFIDRPEIHARCRELLKEVDLQRHPAILIEDLSPGERQLVEIAKALTIDAKLIIFDEPTTSLTSQEADRLFLLIKRLSDQGRSMIYISHNLGEVARLCDEVAVLRDGQLVGSGPIEEFSNEHIIHLMVGRPLDQLFPERLSPPSNEAILEVEGLSQPGIVEQIGFTLHRGEVLGLAGLMGSGRTELARILFGLDRHKQGTIRLGGITLGRTSPRARIRLGMAFLTEDRRAEGLLMEASVEENAALAALPGFAGPGLGLINRRRLALAVEEVGRSVQLRGSGPGQTVRSLSGGNQQKVVLARWLLTRPSVLILDEPTRGVDVGAKAEIYRLINELAGQGAGVLMISSELEELMGLCDRILVLSRGEIRTEFARSHFHREAILRAALREDVKA